MPVLHNRELSGSVCRSTQDEAYSALECPWPERCLLQQISISIWVLQVPAAHIHRLDMIPDIDQSLLKITIVGSQAAIGAAAQVASR